jgi:hypothetical protein
MRANSIDKKNRITMFATSILKCLKKNCKIISSIFKYLKSTFQIVTIAKVQFKYSHVLCKKHNCINLVLEINANNSKKRMYQKKLCYLHKIIYMFLLFQDLILCYLDYFLCIFYHAFTHINLIVISKSTQ